MDLPPPSAIGARHVVLVIAHGLSGPLPPLDDLPNIKTMQRLGLSIERCETGGRPPVETLVLDGGGGLAQAAARGGRRLLQVLPWRPAAWVAARTRGPHWSIVEDRLDENAGTWDDLALADPRLVVEGAGEPGGDDGVADLLRQRVVPRFPGALTMMQGDMGPLEAWMHWVSDAFLRALWFASARWDQGVVGVLCHPAPRLLARRDPEGGYARGLDMVDDLIGRLLVLSEHRELDGSAVILCGGGDGAGDDAAGRGASGATVPLLMAGAGTEPRRLAGPVDLDRVGRWLRELAAAGGSAGELA